MGSDLGTGVGPGSNPASRRNRRRRGRKSSWQLALSLSVLLVAVFLLVFHNVGLSHILGPMFGPGPDSGKEDGGHIGNVGGSGAGDPAGSDHGAGQGNDRPEDLDEEQLALLKPNELGKVMVIMYHDVSEKEGEWVRSRENFRKDLERFYELGYSLIPFNSYLTGDIHVPAGRAPLVLTFDDGTSGQLKTTEQDGVTVADPDCAVGMLLAFSKEHPDFGHAATFYVNFPAPFRDSSRVQQNLEFLIENGMEIGNHTYNHKNLAGVAPAMVAEEVGSLANKVKDIAGYETKSLALPYGGYPSSKDNLGSGQWDGQDYVNLGVLLVGAEAAPSPFSAKINPMAIPRIRGSQEELDKWLGYFQKYPERRFVSDGQADTVTIPGDPDAQPNLDLDLNRVESRKVVTYALPADPG